MDEENYNEGQSVPSYFESLSYDDRKAYEDLRSVLAAPDHRYNRNKRIVTFTDMLEQIKKFCVRNDEDDWKRYLVCGICWIGNDIAINTRQLRILLGKSKSTINGALAKMGYETLPFRNNDNGLMDKIPFLRGNFNETRQWTVRRITAINAVSDCPTDLFSSPEPNVRTGEFNPMLKQEKKPQFTLPKTSETDFDIEFSLTDNDTDEFSMFSEFTYEDDSNYNEFSYRHDDSSMIF